MSELTRTSRFCTQSPLPAAHLGLVLEVDDLQRCVFSFTAFSSNFQRGMDHGLGP